MVGASWLYLAAAPTPCVTLTGGLPGIYDHLNCDSAGNVVIGSVDDVLLFIANIIHVLIALAGGLAIILLLVASIYYITSVGDPGRTKRARDIIQYTVTGLVIIIIAYALVGFIATGL